MKDYKTVAGIDEAGRGAVLGPLVIAGVSFKDNEEMFDILQDWGVNDSKLFTAPKRKEISHYITSVAFKFRTFRIRPRELDRFSLNNLEARYMAKIINYLIPGAVYIDVPATGRGIARYCNMVRKDCNYAPYVNGANKMDSSNILVAAASIIAKEAREKEVKKLHKEYGDFGSGYPSDPKTREWLQVWRKRHNSWPNIVRTKWKTVQLLDHQIARS